MMFLRNSLIVKKVNNAHLKRITALFESLIAAVSKQEDCTSMLADLTEMTGRNDLDEDYFRTLDSHSNLKEAVATVALPRALHVPDLTHEELVYIAGRAMDVLSWDAAYYSDLLNKNVPMQGASDLIHYAPDDYDGPISEYAPTAEQIVRWATSETPPTITNGF